MELTPEQRAILSPEQIALLEGNKPASGEVPNLNPNGENKPVDGKDANRELAETIIKVVEERQNQSQNKALEILWNQQLTANQSGVPGLEDYLKGTDEYGRVIIDELNAVEDFEERSEMLNNITERFAKASTSSNGGVPPVQRKQTQVEKDAEQRYNEVTGKFDEGDYDSISDFQEDFFDAVSKELDSSN